MREISINKNESGQRLDKFLQKYLREATKGFLYKMLRKKNIKLNGSRAEGREILRPGDTVTFYFSEETIEKFRGEAAGERYPVKKLDIIYEDEDVLLINKPAGMLSQKARQEDESLVEYVLGYLQSENKWQPGGAFTPGICNRLDRNTSGIVIAGKSLPGLQIMSEKLRQRDLKKFYYTIVEGKMREASVVRGYLAKDTSVNRVKIYDEPGEGRSYIETGYEPLAWCDGYTYLKVELITGKTHQIRSHLSSIGHPVIQDKKYGAKPVQGLKYFLLHAGELRFPQMPEPLGHLSGRVFTAPFPENFVAFREKFFMDK